MKMSAKCGTMESAMLGAVTDDIASNHKENNPSVVARTVKMVRGAVPSDTLMGEPSMGEGMPDHAEKSSSST